VASAWALWSPQRKRKIAKVFGPNVRHLHFLLFDRLQALYVHDHKIKEKMDDGLIPGLTIFFLSTSASASSWHWSTRDLERKTEIVSTGNHSLASIRTCFLLLFLKFVEIGTKFFINFQFTNFNKRKNAIVRRSKRILASCWQPLLARSWRTEHQVHQQSVPALAWPGIHHS
jgi:hypothetical protein